jgi:hypothetical protein
MMRCHYTMIGALLGILSKMLRKISRPFNDDFSYDLFCKLLEEVSCEYEAYYIWTNPPTVLSQFFNKAQFKAPNIIIGIKDLLDCWKDYNYWKDTQQEGVALLSKMVRKHSDKNFIIFTSLENLNLELNEPNVQIIPWGGDIVNQRQQYSTLVPVSEKNLSSTKTFINLNRNVREHRVVTLSYLFGNNYDQYGAITYLGMGNLESDYEPMEFLDRISWKFDEHHNTIRTSIIQGYSKCYMNMNLVTDNYLIYGPAQDNNNALNFNNSLRDKYCNSFVEIISESSFTAPAYMLTEKTHHSFYAFNFPILIAGAGAVAHLREIGFDMFDDIINHSYDLIINPFDRIISAIDNNHRLLVDAEYAKQSWKDNQHRFRKNLDIAQKGMYEWYENRTISNFNKIVWK